MLIFFISILAETNRVPFDLPEAEAELVAGYNVDYSGFLFAMFFLGEYSNMVLMSVLFVILYFGGWLLPTTLVPFSSIYIVFKSLETFFFIFKILIVAAVFILIRTICPRYRTDQLLLLGWSKILPLSVALVFIYINLSYLLELAPRFNHYTNLTNQQLFNLTHTN
jgi:NADH-quinone oxidoreductase subunit H